MTPSPPASEPVRLGIACSHVTTAALVLALLHFGQVVLIPLTLAFMLSLLAAPLVRALRRLGIARTASVLITVATLALTVTAVTATLTMQVLHIAESLPQYEANVRGKLGMLNQGTVGRLRVLTDDVGRLIDLKEAPDTHSAPAAEFVRPIPALRTDPSAEQLEQAPSHAPQLRRLLTSTWDAVQTLGIVLLVLVFVLLEHESLRDRIIRIAGATDIHAATLALNDAGARLSRYFISQLAVNLAFAVAVWLALSALRMPQAMLLGVLAGVFRFVPYVGVGISALLSSAIAFAVDPGWSLAVSTLGVFIVLDIVAGQFLEPHLYGHATGLSPLAVVVGTIFWSALWGPAGLILSTPLTLCLVVAGRHMNSLGMLDLLLSDAQALTLAQRFYQRALCDDPHEIIAAARAFLRRETLADYCDRVLIPALHIAHLDAERGITSDEQHGRIRRVVVDVVTALSNDRLKLPRRRHAGAVLENVNPGRWLRQQREQVSGKWQGPLGVAPGSVVICAGLGTPADDLVAELLVRLLRLQQVDARHFSPADVEGGLPPGADPDGVFVVYLVSAFPGQERERADLIAQQVRALLPHSHRVRVLCPGARKSPAEADIDNVTASGESVAHSLGQSIQMCVTRQTANRVI